MPCITAYGPTNLKPPHWVLYFQNCETPLKHEKIGWFFLVLVLESFMHWWVNMEGKTFHWGFFCWKWIFAYPKRSLSLQFIDQIIWHSVLASCTRCHWWVCCCRSGLRRGRLWENFCPFVADKVANYCVLEGSDDNRMINDIGFQHLYVVSSIKFQPQVHCSTPVI